MVRPARSACATSGRSLTHSAACAMTSVQSGTSTFGGLAASPLGNQMWISFV